MSVKVEWMRQASDGLFRFELKEIVKGKKKVLYCLFTCACSTSQRVARGSASMLLQHEHASSTYIPRYIIYSNPCLLWCVRWLSLLLSLLSPRLAGFGSKSVPNFFFFLDC